MTIFSKFYQIFTLLTATSAIIHRANIYCQQEVRKKEGRSPKYNPLNMRKAQKDGTLRERPYCFPDQFMKNIVHLAEKPCRFETTFVDRISGELSTSIDMAEPGVSLMASSFQG
jgi:hypothetical protein